MEILMTFLIIGICFFLLSIGLIFNGKKIRGSCGGEQIKVKGEVLECGACPKKEAQICESEDDTGFVRLAKQGHPGPKH